MKNRTLTDRLLNGFPLDNFGVDYFLKLVFITALTSICLLGLYSLLLGIDSSLIAQFYLSNQASTISTLLLLFVFIIAITMSFYFADNKLKYAIPAGVQLKNALLKGSSLIASAVFKERNQKLT